MSGIWIRSQNKAVLINVKHIEYNGFDNSNMWVISSYTQTEHNANLGFYSTKAKALKVLDMIQRHIEKLFTNTNDGNTNYHMFKQVFEMPQDYEV